MTGTLQLISLIFSIITGGFSILVLLCKPFRKWLLIRKKEEEREKQEREDNRETSRCVLRNMITGIYYRNKNNRTIDQYEYEDLEHLYSQYKKLGGNSFVDKIWNDVQSWEVTR